MKFEWIDSNSSVFSVKKMCQILEVSTSGYYDWRDRIPSVRNQTDIEYAKLMKHIQDQVKGTYGSPRMKDEIIAQTGNVINRKRVERIMKNYGISAEKPRIYRVQTTDSDHNLPVAPNLLERNFKPGKLNSVWVSDITYIQTKEGFAYLTLVHDIGNREPVGWHLSNDMTTESILKAFEKAVHKRKPEAGLMASLQ